jgi:16S rRNA (cytidine1402-2'-O)-methyltransferase
LLAGTLYLVATPIGNLEDITLRGLRILREEAALIACEDTRHTQKLLEHYSIRKPLISYHEHNETSRTPELLGKLGAGESIALVSDSGTPLISDPGYRLVSAAIQEGFTIVPVPGSSAVLAALAASGLPTDEFWFIGFVPSKTGARRKRLENLANLPITAVAYESPHRIIDTLAEMEQIFGERKLVLARELTKMHEEFLRGSAREIREQLARRDAIKGEITLVIAKAEQKKTPEDPAAEVTRLEEEGLDRMEAIKTVAKQTGLPKREVYRLVEARGNNRTGTRRD